MTQRTMNMEDAQVIEIRAGTDVRVTGWNHNAVQASTSSYLGLSLERRGNSIRVSLGGQGDVRVPRAVALQVHAGKSAAIAEVTADVTAFTGWDLRVHTAGVLRRSSAGGRLDVDCLGLAPDVLKLEAGRDLRLRLVDFGDLRVRVHDIGGPWEIAFGAGARLLKLNAGGDAVIVTDQAYVVTSPNGVAGLIEAPAAIP